MCIVILHFIFRDLRLDSERRLLVITTKKKVDLSLIM